LFSFRYLCCRHCLTHSTIAGKKWPAKQRKFITTCTLGIYVGFILEGTKISLFATNPFKYHFGVQNA
jgi:hypothetical protein